MAKVTTKTDDTGLTRLLGRERVPKSDPRIALLGAVDEATSALGVARAYSSDARVREIVLHVQCDLYVLMADVATPPQHRGAIGMTITPESVQWLEDVEAAFLAEVDIPNAFILPGGCLEGAALDIARTVIRRAECLEARLVQRNLAANPDALRYLNRLSDVMFILARVVEARQGGSTLARPA